VGVNRAGQNIVFKELTGMGNQLVYDLSSMFSRSMGINQAEKGYNKDKIQVPQINLALVCSADTGLPTMIRSLPGSVKDIKTLYFSYHNRLIKSGKRKYNDFYRYLFEDQDLRLEE
jgi:transposase